MRRIIASAVAAVAVAFAAATVTPAIASEAAALDKQSWPWDGAFGTYDQGALKRGFQVYREVCSNCHSLKLVAYRDLKALGLSEDEIKAIAASKEVEDGPNDQGEKFTRPARPADRFVAPFPNDAAARVANNGALPPDLSLMAKARKGGPDYIYSLMLGYGEPPAGFELLPGMNYNRVFPGHQIGMPPQIFEGLVQYADGTAPTPEQIGRDIASFLNWTAEPELNARHGMGLKTMVFLLVLTALFFALKRQMWSDVHH